MTRPAFCCRHVLAFPLSCLPFPLACFIGGRAGAVAWWPDGVFFQMPDERLARNGTCGHSGEQPSERLLQLHGLSTAHVPEVRYRRTGVLTDWTVRYRTVPQSSTVTSSNIPDSSTVPHSTVPHSPVPHSVVSYSTVRADGHAYRRPD